jgi:MFS family permease
VSICSFYILHNLTYCQVGALSLSAEAIIAALIPVFALQYSGINPKILDYTSAADLLINGKLNLDPVSFLTAGNHGPPLWKISLISSLPLLTNGLSGYLLVPLSIAIGRRPVIIGCGLLAWVGGLWAGSSQSLDSHLAARAVQGLGAGAVEALIPLMVQDMVFLHQRNRAISSIWASQVR